MRKCFGALVPSVGATVYCGHVIVQDFPRGVCDTDINYFTF